ncbi:hypothetical protein SEA_LUCKYLEO_6 [Gordonia phage LuckyLeo]|nr:hypothetical protein SEA_LUCKYLEO_6 [Gordonia phage LuckyLeo]
MAKRKRKAVRKTLKGRAAKGRIPRDKNGKFVNKMGKNASRGPNLKNLEKGRKKRRANKGVKAAASAVAAYAVARYTSKATSAAEKQLSKLERRASKAVVTRLKNRGKPSVGSTKAKGSATRRKASPSKSRKRK